MNDTLISISLAWMALCDRLDASLPGKAVTRSLPDVLLARACAPGDEIKLEAAE